MKINLGDVLVCNEVLWTVTDKLSSTRFIATRTNGWDRITEEFHVVNLGWGDWVATYRDVPASRVDSFNTFVHA